MDSINYRRYFDIDPEYFPQVNSAVINDHPDLWKKFYPHETFVHLLKNTINVLNRTQKVSIWVEGAYGTGKSHAVLTLKKLIDASAEDTKAYFDRYPDQLERGKNVDLLNELQQIKTDGKILTVHRYGTSTITGDDKLVLAIQKSIEMAMQEKGMDITGGTTLVGSVLRWLQDNINRQTFNMLVQGPYRDYFGGDDVDTIEQKLKSFEGDALLALMGNISKMSQDRQLGMMNITPTDLTKWIRSVIKENNLKAILFIWDEFTDFFRKNTRSLTGFQEIVDMSGNDPFYMMIVTHDAMHLFAENDKEFGKIKGRFINPICEISLPDNIAFQLMGEALEIKQDRTLREEWQETIDELYERTNDSRKLVIQRAKITDKELKKILPIHPYSALVLKHISTAFGSDARSMFDYIKNEQDDDVGGFQQFIDNHGPEDDNPLLTIDELWGFFTKDKTSLPNSVRNILNYYEQVEGQLYTPEQRRILKCVLLMQSLSQQVGGKVELFVPNANNIALVFEGSDLELGETDSILKQLERDKILYQPPIGNGKTMYAARISAIDADDDQVEKEKQKILKKATSELVLQGEISSVISLTGALAKRYERRSASSTDIRIVANQLRNLETALGNKIATVVSFARSDKEAKTIHDSISVIVKDPSYDIVFIDASCTPLGDNLLDQYADAMARAVVNKGKDNKMSAQYEKDAKDILKKWGKTISEGEFYVYTSDDPKGVHCTTLEILYTTLSTINRKRYPLGLETGRSVNATMWEANGLKSGVECGATQTTKSMYSSSNVNTKLEKYIGDEVWKQDDTRYWETHPHLLISKIKIAVEAQIQKRFSENGGISIKEIYDMLSDKNGEFGFMPCNLTAFVLGFVLKEYATAAYNYTDGTVSNNMSVDYLKTMIDEIIKLQMTPNNKYKDKYIRTMTPEERTFHDTSSEVFGIARNFCTSVEQTRERIRNKMKTLSFPIWCLKYILDSTLVQTERDVISRLIDLYSGIANSGNIAGSMTESDIATEIGKLVLENEHARDDLKLLITGNNCKAGMVAYIHTVNGGELVRLAAEIGDGGQYINCVQSKFDADAANWVWNQSTADQKIKEVVLEYQIIAESNKINPKALNFKGAIREWCDKCGMIKVSYLYAKNYWDELTDLMSLLYQIKKTGSLQEAQREIFLEQLQEYGEAFTAFYEDQTSIFKKVCSYYLEDFSDCEVKELFSEIKNSSIFTMEKAEFTDLVKKAVGTFKLSRKSVQLRKYWAEKTGFETPRAWSDQYKMPILCMVPENEYSTAKQAFDTLNAKNPGETYVDSAMEYLQHATFFDKLSSADARDSAFRRAIITDHYDVILTDIDDVKRYLLKKVPNPYNWYGLPAVARYLKEMAEARYNETGYETAEEKINGMDVADVKVYLKRLIRENMAVGIEIIRDN